MAVVIAAPASGSGKTLLSLALLSWARSTGRIIQPYKVGPDYLDPQLLSTAAGRSCRTSTATSVVKLGQARVPPRDTDLALVEGVMGLFDELAAARTAAPPPLPSSSTCPWCWWSMPAVGRHAGGFGEGIPGPRPQAAIRRGCAQPCRNERHQHLLRGVGVDRHAAAGCRHGIRHWICPAVTWAWPQPTNSCNRSSDANSGLRWRSTWTCSDCSLLQAPAAGDDPLGGINSTRSDELPVAVATDEAFHFRYPETEELLQHLGMPVLRWSPLADEPLPRRGDDHPRRLPGTTPHD